MCKLSTVLSFFLAALLTGCATNTPSGLLTRLSQAVPDDYQPVTRSGAALLTARRLYRARQNSRPVGQSDEQALADLILALVRDVERLNAALLPSKTPPPTPSHPPP